MRAIFETLVERGIQPDKFQFIEILQQNGRTLANETQSVVAYLEMCKSSIYEMLEHLAADNPKEMFKAVQNLCSVGDYLMYEKSAIKGVYYYAAKHPEVSAGFASGNFSIDTRSNIDRRLISDLFIKQDPELCPLTVAVTNNNVQFLLFALQTIAGLGTTNAKFLNRVSAAVLKLMDQGQDVDCIHEFLYQRSNAAWRPGRWFSFEYALRNAIDNKNTTPMFDAQVARQRNSESTVNKTPSKPSNAELRLT